MIISGILPNIMKSKLPPLVLLTSLSLILVLVLLPCPASGQAVDDPPASQDILDDAFAADIQEKQDRDKRRFNFKTKLQKPKKAEVALEDEPEYEDDAMTQDDPDRSLPEEIGFKRETDLDINEDDERIHHSAKRGEKKHGRKNEQEIEMIRQNDPEGSTRIYFKIFDLGEPCDSLNSGRVEDILEKFGGEDESFIEEKMAHLLSGGRGGFCDHRKFLICKSEICQYWNPGVVGVDQSDSKMTYDIEAGQVCGGYPKYYETKVRLQCANKRGDYCSRVNPKLCSPPAGGPHKPPAKTKKGRKSSTKKGSKQAQKKQKAKSHKGRSDLQLDESNKTIVHYGHHCTNLHQCEEKYFMACQADHLILRAGAEQASGRSGVEQDVLELDYFDGLPILGRGMPEADEGVRNAIYDDLALDYSSQGHEEAKVPKKHFICRCREEYAPFAKATGHVICRTAADYNCESDKECASEHCVDGFCQLSKKFLFFVTTGERSDHLQTHPHDLVNEDEDDEDSVDGADPLAAAIKAESRAAPLGGQGSKLAILGAISFLFVNWWMYVI